MGMLKDILIVTLSGDPKRIQYLKGCHVDHSAVYHVVTPYAVVTKVHEMNLIGVVFDKKKFEDLGADTRKAIEAALKPYAKLRGLHKFNDLFTFAV